MNRRSFWLGFLAGAVLTVAAVYIVVRKFTVQPDVSLNKMELEDLNGKPVNMLGLLGKPIVINYWATWCAPCRKEFPEFDAAKKAWENKVEFLMVSDEAMTDIVSFRSKYPYTFNYFKVIKGFENVNARPTTFIYNRKGTLVVKHTGGMSEHDLSKILSSIE